MSDDVRNRRKHERVSAQVAIFIEVVGGRGLTEAHNTIFRCETLDISAKGLKVWVPLLIPKGCTLNIAVPGEDLIDNLELVGECMWVQKAQGKSGYWVGLQLKDSSSDHMQRWFKIAHQMKHDS